MSSLRSRHNTKEYLTINERNSSIENRKTCSMEWDSFMGLFYILYITVQVSLWIVWQFNVIGEIRSVPLLSNIYCDVCYEAQFHYTLGYFRIFYGRWSLNHYVRIFFINIYYKLLFVISGPNLNFLIIVLFHFLVFPIFIQQYFKALYCFCLYYILRKIIPYVSHPVLKAVFPQIMSAVSFLYFFTMSSGLICPTHFKNLSVTSLSEISFIIVNVSIISPLKLRYLSVDILSFSSRSV
jgi:hypothetical protein